MRIEGFSGDLVVPDSGDYDRLRRVWNRAVDHRPRAIARCSRESDVLAALRHARRHDWPVSVRGGGHGFAGQAVADGALVLDLRGLRHAEVDPGRRVARIGAGLTWGAFDSFAAPFGLAATGGSMSKVGVVGYSLGTGLGWLGRLHGLAGDNLVGARVVTADGERLVETGAQDHPDLFWALRGGGGNFGVVTELTTRLHPVGTVLAGPVIHALEDAVDTVEEVRELSRHADARVDWVAVLTTLPAAAPIPPRLRGRPALMVPMMFVGDPDEGRKALQPLRRAGRPLLDFVDVTSYGDFQRSSDQAAPEGVHWDVRSEWLTALDTEAVRRAADAVASVTSPLSEVLLRPLSGAVNGPDAPHTAFGHRDAGCLVEVIAGWPSGPAAPHRAWMRRTWQALLPWSAGGPCVSHIGVGEGPERVRAAYTAQAWERLRGVKGVWDPANVLRSVPNIAP